MPIPLQRKLAGMSYTVSAVQWVAARHALATVLRYLAGQCVQQCTACSSLLPVSTAREVVV